MAVSELVETLLIAVGIAAGLLAMCVQAAAAAAGEPRPAHLREQGPRTRLAPERQSRWGGMTISVAFLCMAFGIVWHTIVVLLMGGLTGGLTGGLMGPGWFWRMLAGLVAGLAAGAFTVWSRERQQGRESFVLGLATYYFAVAVYSVSLNTIGIVVELFRGVELPDAARLLFIGLFYAFLYGSVLGVVLIPLCFLTRHLLWQFHVKMLPNKPQQPPSAPSGARG